MADRYQTGASKSTKKFELPGKKELAVSVPLPLVEVWEQLQPEVEHLTGLAGLQIVRAVIDDEVTRRAEGACETTSGAHPPSPLHWVSNSFQSAQKMPKFSVRMKRTVGFGEVQHF